MEPLMEPLKLDLQYIHRDDRKEYVVMPMSDFQAMVERIEDLMDLADLREAKLQDDGERIPLEQVVRELGLDRVVNQSAA